MWRALSCSGRKVLPNATAVHDRAVLRSVGRLQRGGVAGAGSAVDGVTDRECATVLVAPPFGSMAQRSPCRTLDLVGLGVPRRVLYANQRRCMGVRGALPPAGRALLLARSRATTSVVRSFAQRVGAGGVGSDRVSLLYPGINAVLHFSVSRIPAFGVPCPTMIFTAGVLMLATPRSWRLSIIPVMWSVIGGSAASLLGVRADYALPIAGIALAVFSLQRRSDARTVLEHGQLHPRFRS